MIYTDAHWEVISFAFHLAFFHSPFQNPFRRYLVGCNLTLRMSFVKGGFLKSLGGKLLTGLSGKHGKNPQLTLHIRLCMGFCLCVQKKGNLFCKASAALPLKLTLQSVNRDVGVAAADGALMGGYGMALKK
jgi:hypothetical protein